MKHIKTYKLFENNQSESETICEEIEDILLPLKDDAILKIDIDIDHRQDGEFIYLTIKDDNRPDETINIDEFSYEFKQLFSYMKSEGWEIDYENRPYHKTNYFIRFPYVELTEPDLICPECDSNQTSPASSDHDETECKCYDCGHRSDIDDFKKYLLRIEEESMFFDFIKRDLDKIFIKFIKE